MPTIRKVPSQACQLRAGPLDLAAGDAPPVAKILARSGEAIDHWYWGKLCHDLAGMELLKPRVPLDYCHDPAEIIGFAEGWETESGNLTCSGTLLTAESPRAAEVAAMSRAGVPYEASISFQPLAIEELSERQVATVNGRQVEGPAAIVRRWQLRGLAVCPRGADPNTRTELAEAGEIEVTILSKETAMSDQNQETPEQIAARVQTELTARLTDYTQRFGPQGQAWALSSRPLAECCTDLVTQLREAHGQELAAAKTAQDAAAAELQTKLTAAEAQAAELQARLAAIGVGEKTPVSTAPGEGTSQLTAAEQSQLTPAMAKFVGAMRAGKRAAIVLLCAGLLSALCSPLFGQAMMPRPDRLRQIPTPATSDLLGVVRGTTPYKITVEDFLQAADAAGAAVSAKAAAAESGLAFLHQTVLTFTLTGANDLDLADGAHGTGVKVYDFPAGRILILGATINASIAHNGAFNASTADTFSFGVGTAVGADDDALTSTEVDLIPSQTMDTDSGATSPLTAGAALAASAQFDGTSTAKDVYVNVACAAANNSGATTYAVTGTLTLTWINLGDY